MMDEFVDVVTPPVRAPQYEIDPKQELLGDVERMRAERDDLDRQIATDRDRLTSIRAALDSMVNATWRHVFGQQQSAREKENITSALTLGWVGGYQLVFAAAFVAIAAALVVTLQIPGAVAAVALYVILALAGYFVARDQCLALIKKTRASYLASDGKDMRFVAFTKYEPGLTHPLLGYDGPVDGTIQDRAWKIPGIREKDALTETFVEVLDDRRTNVLLTRFPDRKPTLVHADLENPFIRAYGVSFQRALEKHLPAVATHAHDFRQVVTHMGERKALDERLGKVEEELREFDGTQAIINQMNAPASLRQRLLRSVLKFRLGDPSVRRGTLLVTGDRVDTMDVLQSVARASAATLLHLSFSQIKIGYVGQGAATVSRIFDTARRARAIVFIDEAERFFETTGSAAYEAMRREVVQAIFTEWDALEGRSDVWVIAASREREGLDDGIVARFGTLIDFAPDAQHDEPVSEDPSTQFVDGAAIVAAQEALTDEISDPVVARTRLLAAMFAHVETMEAQGITVPRAVLLAGPSETLKRTIIESLAEQTSLPLFGAVVDDLDRAMAQARGTGRALVAVDVPEYSQPGAVAHLAVTIDNLVATKAPIFILGTSLRADTMDPELRSRFPEVIELAELDGPTRRERLRELLATKPIGFHLEVAMNELESRSDGMTEEMLRQFVDEAGRKAALRAIDGGTPSEVLIMLADFERRAPRNGPVSEPPPMVEAATEGDEAAL